MPKPNYDVIIAGAGPVGLAHALFLTQLGCSVFICDQKSKPTQESRAVGINPRSLELLDTVGVSTELIKQGIKATRFNIHLPNTEILITLHLDLLEHRYPFLLALPQDQTEKILVAALKKAGVTVHWDTVLTSFEDQKDYVTASLKQKKDTKSVSAKYLIGADGAHSVVRKSLGFNFNGVALPDQWSMIDANADWPEDWGVADLFPLGQRGILFAVQIGPGRYRIISNKPNVQSLIPKQVKIKKVLWASDFQVHCRQVEQYQKGRVFLMGDAAHIHSPAGGRGMNLGIEDAYVLAQLIHRQQTERYSQLRKPVGHKVIKLTNRLFRFAGMTNPIGIIIRNWLLRHVIAKPTIQKKMIRTLLGINYPTGV